MASSTFSQRALFIAVLTLAIFAISAAARPCKTLFISSYSFSLRRLPSASSSSGYVTVVTEISRLRPVRLDDEVFIHRHVDAAEGEKRTETAPLFPVIGTASSAASFYDLGSLRDRTRDILSVVVSLLFGVGCGALTSATMYLAWSLFAGRCDGGCSEHASDYDFDDASPKNMGYVKIPEVAAADSTVKEAVAA